MNSRIIRNPINRLISGYLKVCYRATRDSPNILKNKFYWVVDQKKRFYTFIDELERGFFDCHIELQYFYLSDQNEKLFDIDYYLKVEQLDIDFSKMCQKLKLNYSLLHFNEASKREKSNMINNLINSINILVKMLQNILYIIFNQSLKKETLLSMYQNIFNRIKYVFIRRPLPSAIDIWSLIQEDTILQQRIYNLYEKDFDLYFNN